MGHEWIETVAAVLETAGIRAGEEYPAGKSREITEPVAALGIQELDWAENMVRVSVKILSPRRLGGWVCQNAGVNAAAALEAAGICCKSGGIHYQNGNDCFCVVVTASMEIEPVEQVLPEEKAWTVRWNEVELPGVEKFVAREDRGRRLIGAFCQAEPVGVTPPTGGYSVTLVQVLEDAEPEEPEEPFALTVTNGECSTVYTGCYWNRITRTHTKQGIQVEHSGFALGREEA